MTYRQLNLVLSWLLLSHSMHRDRVGHNNNVIMYCEPSKHNKLHEFDYKFGVVVEVSDGLGSTCLRFKLQHAPGRACPRPPRVVSHYIHTHQVPLYIVHHLPPPTPLPLLPKTSSIFQSAPELTIYQVLVSKFLSYGYLLSFTF